MYINKHAVDLHCDKEARRKLWRFDDDSYLYWSKKDKKLLSKKGKGDLPSLQLIQSQAPQVEN
jgi:hypothetical protein